MCITHFRYRIVTHLSSRVSFLNPAWNSKDVDPNKQFLKAVELTGKEFVQHVNYAANIWLPARSIVQEAIEKRFEVNKTRCQPPLQLMMALPWTLYLCLSGGRERERTREEKKYAT